MDIVYHRRNTRALLDATPRTGGVEVDIRSYGDRLVIHHDPFQPGEDFETWMEGYQHGLLILNVKEEGLEDRLLRLMDRHKVRRFFFLDQSFPFLVKTARGGERRCAVRISEYESVETALRLARWIDWAWIDCFTRFPLSAEEGRALRVAGLNLCIVSPELQGRSADADITGLRQELAEKQMGFDAVCTKRPDLWS